MNLPTKLRVLGWVVSLSGAALLVFSGGFGTRDSQIWAMAGAITMVLGMILTSTSSLVAHLQHMRSLRRPPTTTCAPGGADDVAAARVPAHTAGASYLCAPRSYTAPTTA